MLYSFYCENENKGQIVCYEVYEYLGFYTLDKVKLYTSINELISDIRYELFNEYHTVITSD